MLDGDPRITLDARGGPQGQTGVSVTPYMMAAGDERVIADRLHRAPVEAARAASGDGARDPGR